MPKGYRPYLPDQELLAAPSLREWPPEDHLAYLEDVQFRVLAAGNAPDFRTISDFRKIHIGALQGLFEQAPSLTPTTTRRTPVS